MAYTIKQVQGEGIRMTKTSKTIIPVEGYSVKLGLYLAQMEETRQRTLEYIAGLSKDTMSWIPGERCECIGTLILHIAAVERSWIGEDIERREMESWWEIAFPIRLGIPQVKGYSMDYYLGILETTRQETREALKKLSDSDLTRMITPLESESDEEKEYSIEWILFHLIEHEALHAGQISLLKRLAPK